LITSNSLICNPTPNLNWTLTPINVVAELPVLRLKEPSPEVNPETQKGSGIPLNT
jgi:hypothetical protein